MCVALPHETAATPPSPSYGHPDHAVSTAKHLHPGARPAASNVSVEPLWLRLSWLSHVLSSLRRPDAVPDAVLPSPPNAAPTAVSIR
eukprot:3138964-Prymnesium_polylepis.1